MAVITLASAPQTTPAVTGQMEYASPVATFTPNGLERGVMPAAQFYRLNTDLVGANVSTAQNIIGKGVTLSAGTVYAFEAVFAISKSAGVTGHSVGIGFGGTATLNNIAYSGLLTAGSTSLTNDSVGTVGEYIQTAANTTFSNGSSTSATRFLSYSLKGTISVNAGGTLIPQYTLSAAPGGAYTTAAGSYFLIYPIGTAGADVSVGTWA